MTLQKRISREQIPSRIMNKNFLLTQYNLYTRIPPPPLHSRCSYEGNRINKKYNNEENEKRGWPKRASRDASTCLGATRRFRSVSRPYRIPVARRVLGQLVSLRRLYASVYDHNFPSLGASLFSWRCLAASTSYLFHATMNLRPPFATDLAHISASSLSNPPPLYQTPGCRFVRNWSPLSHPHPVPSALHLQGFRTRFALAIARRSCG